MTLTKYVPPLNPVSVAPVRFKVVPTAILLIVPVPLIVLVNEVVEEERL